MFIDANARVGSIASSFIGSKDVGEKRKWFRRKGVCGEREYPLGEYLPPLGGTWVHTSGSESRIDYVSLTEKLHGTNTHAPTHRA